MKKTIPVIGMACSACSARVEDTLRAMAGVSEASVNLIARTATVDFDPAAVSLQEMKRAVSAVGYDMVIDDTASAEAIERRATTLLSRRTILAWLLAVITMCVQIRWIDVGGRDAANQLSLILAAVCLVMCARDFYVNAFKQLRHRAAGMDLLITLSTAITFAFSAFNTFAGEAVWTTRGITWSTWFDAATMIVAFVLTGRLLEEKAKNATATSLRQLMGMKPKTARVVDKPEPTDGEDDAAQVPIATIEAGDILEVRAGEKIPVDGTVTWADSFMTAGVAYVDQSMMTGEPAPAPIKKGDTVMAGTIPSQGKLRLRARQVGEETALARIIATVEQAQNSKAPVQRVVDLAAAVFVPAVAGIALITFILWLAIGGTAALPQAIMHAVATLVVACPCAMGLATPAALMVAMGKAAQSNILIKDSTALERLRKVNAIVTDKTGTLTIPNKDIIDFTKADDLTPGQRETLKPNVTEAVAALTGQGIEVHMLSGDREEAVAYWARKAGITHYKSGVLPGDKELLVKQLQEQGKTVAMMGDGINDTQALANADVSIAIGTGTDVAIDAAQVTLMTNDMNALPRAIQLSRRTVGMIAQNLFWAFIYNIVSLPLAAGALYLFGIRFSITPSWAAALMALSSISVLLNTLRLKNTKI